MDMYNFYKHITCILVVLSCWGISSADEDVFAFIPNVKVNLTDGVHIAKVSQIECAIKCIEMENCTSYMTINENSTCVLRTPPLIPPDATAPKIGLWVKRSSLYNNDCSDVFWNGMRDSGVYTLQLLYNGIRSPFQVYCDMETDGGRWLVFQKRYSGYLTFDKSWKDFKEGFGDLKSEFWLGNRWIHRIAKGLYELRVDLEDFEGNRAFAIYAPFKLGGSGKFYNLSLGSYIEGNAGDSLRLHEGSNFSTKDKDHEQFGLNLADIYGGGWWHMDGSPEANLNGQYGNGGTEYAKGILWGDFKGYYYSLKKSEMKIRPVL